MPHSSKSKPTPKPSFSFEAIGTVWAIELYDTVTIPNGLEVAIATRIEEFDKDYSRFRDDSLVSRMASKAGTYTLPADAKPLLDIYEQLYSLTKGQVTPLVGQMLSDAGYDTHYTLQPGEVRTAKTWSDTLEYDWPQLKLKHPALLDFSAAGKGYLVDIVSEIIEAHGVAQYCVDAGGDIRVRSHEPLRIGLEHPLQLEEAIGVATLTNQSLCGSASNRRAWGEYHHIMNPVTAQPVRDVIAVWVVADSTLIADALSTCLFFVSPNQLQQAYTFEYVLIRSDMSLEHSKNFPAELF